MFDNLDSRQAFLLTLSVLKRLNKIIFSEEALSNLEVNRYFPKGKIKKLKGNLNGCLAFSKKLVICEDTPLKELLKKKKMIHDWQQELTSIQMKQYGLRNYPEQNKNISLMFHNLLDIYYHIFCKLLANKAKAKCFWCQEDLGLPWKLVLEKLILTKTTKVIMYLSVILNTETPQEDILSEFLDRCFEDVKFLVRNSVK